MMFSSPVENYFLGRTKDSQAKVRFTALVAVRESLKAKNKKIESIFMRSRARRERNLIDPFMLCPGRDQRS